MTATEVPAEGSGGTDEDASLVERARKGDVAAFERLYRKHSGRLYSVCLRLHGDHSQAEDALQESFIHAWERLDAFRGDAAFGTWLYRIAVNTTLGKLRSRIRHERHLQAVPDELLENIPDIGHDTGMSMDLEAAVASLPDGARTVLVLHDIEGYGHREIAEMTGIAVGTSKAQLHRARGLLRRRVTR